MTARIPRRVHPAIGEDRIAIAMAGRTAQEVPHMMLSTLRYDGTSKALLLVTNIEIGGSGLSSYDVMRPVPFD